MPNSQNFLYAYQFDTGGQIRTAFPGSSFLLTDIPDNAGDDTNVLTYTGNFSALDQFSIAYSTSGGTQSFIAGYLSHETDPSKPAGIYGYSDQGGNYLITDRLYAVGGQVDLSSYSRSNYTIACYATGTSIRTVRGDIAVERLAADDLVMTTEGRHRPIRWIGRRTLHPHRHGRPDLALPVRIRAHAFGENQPARDLRVSPGHAIAVDVLGEVLIPAAALVNGLTIVQEDVARVTYWHVELDSHDVLIAEGLGAESYLDTGNRTFFADSAVVALAAAPDPDAASRTHAGYCRPFHAAGPLVDLVRAQVAARTDALAAEAQEVVARDIVATAG